VLSAGSCVRGQVQDDRQTTAQSEANQDSIGNWVKGLNPDDVLADIKAAEAVSELAVLAEKDFAFYDSVLTDRRPIRVVQ
jgi:hypothetical protein